MTFITYMYQRKNKKSLPIEQLKNALLSYALMKVKVSDIDESSFSYKHFDGTKLPMLSGCDIEMACFSYILDKYEFRKGEFYSSIMEDKLDAITKYLDTNLGTQKQVTGFFRDFIDTCTSSNPTITQDSKEPPQLDCNTGGYPPMFETAL